MGLERHKMRKKDPTNWEPLFLPIRPLLEKAFREIDREKEEASPDQEVGTEHEEESNEKV